MDAQLRSMTPSSPNHEPFTLKPRLKTLNPALCYAQAGCRIAELATALREAGLTLPNYASIREQAVGGFIQVRAWAMPASAAGESHDLPGMLRKHPSCRLITCMSGNLLWVV